MKFHKYYNIVNRIMSGFILLIIMIFSIAVLGIYILEKNNTNSSFDTPVLFSLKDYFFLISESEKLTNNWIYSPNNSEKENLNKILTKTYPDLKSEILLEITKINSAEERDKISELLVAYDNLATKQKQIMAFLASEEDYANDVKVDEAIKLYEKQFKPEINSLREELQKFSERKKKSFQDALMTQYDDNNLLSLILKIIVPLSLIIGGAIYLLMRHIFSQPLSKLKQIVLALGRDGEIMEMGDLKKRDSFIDGYKSDEIGQMVEAITVLTDGIRGKTGFADEIGKGNYEKEFQPLSEKDIMGKALIEMRNNLKKVAEDDKRRNWATEGLAKFGEILRLNNDNLEVLANDIISNLVKYLKANQGGLFIVDDSIKDKTHLELTACYAFERKKYITKKINLGEGLVGQAWQEGEFIYLTEVPNDYVQITSGLGSANPRCILIMPLKINENTFGVLEIASFNTLEKYEIEFVQKLSESIASTVSTAKINERTKKLLFESQQQAEELKAQEEEVRQNMEEMTATQEELQRKEIETQKLLSQSKTQEEKLRKNMEEMAASQEAIYRYKEDSEAQRKTIHSMSLFSKTDIDGNIIYVNDEFVKASGYSKEELLGKNHRILKSGYQPESFYKDLWNTISNGKVWRNEIKNKAKNGTFYWVDTAISAILDKDGKPKEYIAQGFVITDKKKKEELLLHEIEEFKRKNK